MQTSDKGIALIKQFEGCKLTAYQDSVGVWTIGYGWTQPVDGKPIRAGMAIKQETAERLLKTGLVSYESDVSRLVKVGLTQGQFDAWCPSRITSEPGHCRHRLFCENSTPVITLALPMSSCAGIKLAAKSLVG